MGCCCRRACRRNYTLRLGLYDALDPGARPAVDGADGLELGRIVIP